MWLKSAIAITFILLFLSLAGGFFFLIRDKGKSKRTLYSLGLRIVLAIILIILIGYGVLSGELKSQAPWSTQVVNPPIIQDSPPQSNHSHSSPKPTQQ